VLRWRARGGGQLAAAEQADLANLAAVDAIRVRDERPADFARVHALHSAAFGQPDEADLVVALRSAARPLLSLVAEVGDRVVGHVLFSPIRLEQRPELAVAGLAPIAVDPGSQGRGVGGRLVRSGLERCRELGWRAVFLVGDPGWYARFGFDLAAPRGFRYRSERFDPALQVIELEPGALAGIRGAVHYHDVFESIETTTDH
jgi:putative acetyltransferase